MNKLHREVAGQAIQFLVPPRIFNSLSGDLPSGAVKLPNGETAYWRLHRNLTELKKQRKNMKDLTVNLAKAFKALTTSSSFLNHYGLTKAPDIATETQLANHFRALLGLNTNRVEYSSIHNGNKKPLIETITISLGNLAYCNAHRGIQGELPKAAGIKGRLWLKETADEDQCFYFTVVSPVINLADYMSADRLSSEILNKVRQNLPLLTHNPIIEFDAGQFEGYTSNSLAALVDRHAPVPNGNSKKAKQKQSQAALAAGADKISKGEIGEDGTVVVNAPPVSDDRDLEEASTDANTDSKNTFRALSKEEFDKLSDTDQGIYITTMANWAREGGSADVLKSYLTSGILDELYSQKFTSLTQPYFLAVAIGMSDQHFHAVMGDDAAVNLAEQADSKAAEDAAAVENDQAVLAESRLQGGDECGVGEGVHAFAQDVLDGMAGRTTDELIEVSHDGTPILTSGDDSPMAVQLEDDVAVGAASVG